MKVQNLIHYIANRFWLIMLIYLVSVLLAAGLFASIEQRSFADGLWWAVVTALTIGYGDIAPVTDMGRLMGVLFGHFWIFGVVPMIVANIITNLLHDEHQFSHQEQEWTKASLERIADRLDIKLPESPTHKPD